MVVTFKSATGADKSVSVEELLLEFGSVIPAGTETEAMLVIAPVALEGAYTVAMYVTLVNAGRLGKSVYVSPVKMLEVASHVAPPVPVQLSPALVNCAGDGLYEKGAAVTAYGPLFVTMIVKVSATPGVYVVLLFETVTARSAVIPVGVTNGVAVGLIGVGVGPLPRTCISTKNGTLAAEPSAKICPVLDLKLQLPL